MFDLIKIFDQKDLVSTSNFPHAKFSFPNFNPVQSRIIEFHDKNANFLISAPTSCGKTCVAEVLLSFELRVNKKKGMYIAPLKALAQEKYDDWTSENHHFSDLNVSICTGDFLLTAKRKKELEKADIIIMSNEMLNNRLRNYKSEKSEFLTEVGTLVMDEFQIISSLNRGSHIESGLMKFAKINQKSRIVLLSATVPNSEEIGKWICSLTNKNTYLLESSYRPCPLSLHYEKYYNLVNSYEENEQQKVYSALQIIESYVDDKFLVFVHTKKTGDLMLKTLRKAGIECELHNADVEKSKRNKVEKRFREDPKLRVVVATSTLAIGCNFPARRVIVVGVHRGLSEVSSNDIQQFCGRAGRPQYDDCGDAYILLPETEIGHYVQKLQKLQKIQSQMLGEKDDFKTLAFHLVSEIYYEEVKTREDIYSWFENTLAFFQSQELPEHIVDKVVDSLLKCNAIYEENGIFSITSLGKISSLFYYSPFDVYDFYKNFTKLFEENNENNDYWLAYSLGNVDSHKNDIVSNAEKEELYKFREKLGLNLSGNGYFKDSILKTSYCYFCLLKGIPSQNLASLVNNFRIDLGRLKEVLVIIDKMKAKWGREKFFNEIYLRCQYGVESNLLDLVKLDGVGKVKARRLWDHGLTSLNLVAVNLVKVIQALGCSKEVAEKIVEDARGKNEVV